MQTQITENKIKKLSELSIVPALNYPEEVRELFNEYTKKLIEGDPKFELYLKIQNFDQELEDLSLKYGPPKGRLYLAFYKGELAGCIGLKQIDNLTCELKRLYVRPSYRKQHLGSALVNRVLEEAKSIGYQSILLDTLPFLKEAIALYRKIGFREIDCFNDQSPMDNSLYFKFDLNNDLIRFQDTIDLIN